MNGSIRVLAPAVIIGVGLIAASYVWSAPGTLAPPAGPIEGTGRTLDEVYDRIEQAEASQSVTRGPWLTRFIDTSSTQSTITQTIPGSVLVHAVYVNGAKLDLYQDTFPGSIVGSVESFIGDVNGSAFPCLTASVVYDRVFPNGVYVSWLDSPACTPNATIVYKHVE